jgi:hypothetical protein
MHFEAVPAYTIKSTRFPAAINNNLSYILTIFVSVHVAVATDNEKVLYPVLRIQTILDRIRILLYVKCTGTNFL